ncbi:ComF family protein [Microcella alkalica]|uniref:ComF family protein n=1 Tax=Microcella alkalica TaxID=355930 RepID=UPI00145E6436|nr:phosphoribosyltransferase family protein [Microcella alkalica]
MLLARALLDAAALVAPVDCAGCGAPDRALCPACAAQLAPTPRTALLDVAPDHPPLPIVAGTAYAGAARAALLALKEEGRTELARPLRAPLLAALELAYALPLAEGAVLVPVPGSRAALGRRGFQPVELLARRAGLAVARALELAPEPRDGRAVVQKQRSLAERTSLRSEPRVTRDLQGRRVVLLDDVVTSGATLRAAARALARAGAAVVGGAAIAATPRRHGESAIRWHLVGALSARQGDEPGTPQRAS